MVGVFIVSTDHILFIRLLSKPLTILVHGYHNINGVYVRHSSYQSGSPQNGLRVEWTCGMTLASAYMLYCLSAA